VRVVCVCVCVCLCEFVRESKSNHIPSTCYISLYTIPGCGACVGPQKESSLGVVLTKLCSATEPSCLVSTINLDLPR
jgi:hypothetical protein